MAREVRSIILPFVRSRAQAALMVAARALLGLAVDALAGINIALTPLQSLLMLLHFVEELSST